MAAAYLPFEEKTAPSHTEFNAYLTTPNIETDFHFLPLQLLIRSDPVCDGRANITGIEM